MRKSTIRLGESAECGLDHFMNTTRPRSLLVFKRCTYPFLLTNVFKRKNIETT
jgi:hypothetical protein